MHDASESYYIARGQVDLARLFFLYEISGPSVWLRMPSIFGFLSAVDATTLNTPRGERIDLVRGRKPDSSTLVNDAVKEWIISWSWWTEIKYIGIALPFIDISTGGATDFRDAYAVSSGSAQNPQKLKLFPTDAEGSIRKFGTSQENPSFHRLSSRNAGGLRFDLRGVDTKSSSLNILKITFSSQPTLPGTITIKMQYLNTEADPVKTFTADADVKDKSEVDLKNLSGNIQEIKPDGTVETAGTSTLFSSFLNNNCQTASICSLSLILNGQNTSVDFQLIADQKIPDLNAIVIGDGLSNNKLYHQRIIELISTSQDI